MNERVWYDNWWMGTAYTFLVIDALRAFGISGRGAPRVVDFVADAIFLAVIILVSFRNRQVRWGAWVNTWSGR